MIYGVDVLPLLSKMVHDEMIKWLLILKLKSRYSYSECVSILIVRAIFSKIYDNAT